MEEQIDLMYIDAVRDVKLLALAYPEMYSLATRIMTPHRAEILSNTMKVQSPSLCLPAGASSKRGHDAHVVFDCAAGLRTPKRGHTGEGQHRPGRCD